MLALTNPYQHAINTDLEGANKLQVSLEPNDKSLIGSLRPTKGTLQLVVSNLIFNLCNELRSLDITSYRADGDTILATLCQPRPLTDAQRELLRCTSARTSSQVSPRVQHNRGGSGVRKESTATPPQRGDETRRVNKRKRDDSGEPGTASEKQEGDPTKNDSE